MKNCLHAFVSVVLQFNKFCQPIDDLLIDLFVCFHFDYIFLCFRSHGLFQLRNG